MPEDDISSRPKRQFHSLRQAADELGLGYKQAMTLAANGYFGTLTRSGKAGLGPYVIPDATLQKLRNGEQVSS